MHRGRKKLGPPGEEIEGRISALSDLHRLDELLDRIMDVATREELMPSREPEE